VLGHHLAEIKRCVKIVAVVEQRFLHRFAHRLEAGKMDDGLRVRRLLEHCAQRVEVEQVHLVKGDGFAAQRFHPPDRFPARVAEVVDDGDPATGVEQFQAGVAADIAGAAGDDHMHPVSPRGDSVHRGRWKAHRLAPQILLSFLPVLAVFVLQKGKARCKAK
jgi:hypothetical protein